MEYITSGRIVDMMGRCLVDLFSQDRYLLNRVDMMGRCLVDLFFQDRYLLNRVDMMGRCLVDLFSQDRYLLNRVDMMGRCLVDLFFQDRYLLNRVDMMSRCLVDLFSQDRYLLNRVDLKVRLVQSKDASALARAADQDYKIVEAALFARKAKVILPCRWVTSWYRKRVQGVFDKARCNAGRTLTTCP